MQSYQWLTIESNETQVLSFILAIIALKTLWRELQLHTRSVNIICRCLLMFLNYAFKATNHAINTKLALEINKIAARQIKKFLNHESKQIIIIIILMSFWKGLLRRRDDFNHVHKLNAQQKRVHVHPSSVWGAKFTRVCLCAWSDGLRCIKHANILFQAHTSCGIM